MNDESNERLIIQFQDENFIVEIVFQFRVSLM